MNKVESYIEKKTTVLFTRLMCWLSVIALRYAMHFRSVAYLLKVKKDIDELFDKDGKTFEGLIADMYRISSEANWLWLWKTAEVWEKFYKEASWIEVI